MKAVVVGGGVAGYTFAAEFARKGNEVTLVERSTLGGTCLNLGCIPTKALLESAKKFAMARREGLSSDFDGEKALERKNSIVKKLRDGISQIMKMKGVTVINGDAVITADGVSVNGVRYLSDTTVIASGSFPARPPLQGIEYCVSSDEILSGDIEGEAIAVIGGGVIGLELATFFAEIGRKVTVLEALPNILSGDGGAKYLSLALKKAGITVKTSAKVLSVERTDVGLVMEYEEKDKVCRSLFDKVICAVGRKANEVASEIEIEFDRGYVVDGGYQTSARGVFAIGDCIKGTVQLAHNAAFQARRLAALLSGEESELAPIPACVYTHPNYAYVGDRNVEDGTEIGNVNLAANGRAVTMDESFGYVKVWLKNGILVGFEEVGSEAGEHVGFVSNLIKMKAKKEDIIGSIYPHPTVSEAFSEAVANAK